MYWRSLKKHLELVTDILTQYSHISTKCHLDLLISQLENVRLPFLAAIVIYIFMQIKVKGVNGGVRNKDTGVHRTEHTVRKW